MRKKKALINVANTGRNVTEKLEIGEYAIRHGVAPTLRYFSLKNPGISKQSISDFKEVC